MTFSLGLLGMMAGLKQKLCPCLLSRLIGIGRGRLDPRQETLNGLDVGPAGNYLLELRATLLVRVLSFSQVVFALMALQTCLLGQAIAFGLAISLGDLFHEAPLSRWHQRYLALDRLMIFSPLHPRWPTSSRATAVASPLRRSSSSGLSQRGLLSR